MNFKLPEPALFAHMLINGNHKDEVDCVWLGVHKRGICEQAYTKGETGEEVREFYAADQLKQALRDVLEQAAQKCDYYGHAKDNAGNFYVRSADCMLAVQAIRTMIGEIE